MSSPKKEINLNDQQHKTLFFQNKDLVLFFKYNPHVRKNDFEGQGFFIGKFKLFMEQKMYTFTLWSKPHLNPTLNWSQHSFDTFLEELKYFKILQEVQDMTSIVSLVVDSFENGQSFLLLKVRMQQQVVMNMEKQLWDQFQRYSKQRYTALNEKIQDFKFNQIQYVNALDHLERSEQLKNQNIDDLCGQLSVLMHEKQAKLMEVTGNSKRFSYKISKEQIQGQQKKIQSGATEWMSSQDDHFLMGSMFSPSQNYQF